MNPRLRSLSWWKRSIRGSGASLACLCAGVALTLVASSASADVILHAFNWRYADIESRAQDIKDAGYRIVMVAPAHRSEGSQWWARYQPQDLRLIDGPLGNREAFKKMVDALDAKGVRVYADVVLNHMANEHAARPNDLSYPGQRVLNQYAANTTYFANQKLFGNLANGWLGAGDFGPKICIANYEDVLQVQNHRLCMGEGDVGLPDLIGNSWVVAQQKEYLLALKSLKVKGFRIDAVKHMKSAHIADVFTSTIKSGVHVFGEVITGGGVNNSEYHKYLEPYLNSTDHGAYDFPLQAQLRKAFGFGGSMNHLVDPGAYGQALPGNRAITFTITHDIPTNSIFRFMMMQPVDETLAYAYILGRKDGVPMVYSDHNESGDNRWVDAYLRSDIKGMVKFHNAAQGNDMQVLSNGDCHLLFRRGNRGIVGINKCDTWVHATVNMSNSVLWWNTDYRDQVGGSDVVRISSSNYSFALPPRKARMWMRN